ncbi:ArsR/SmtB family transcription factor [Salinigranum salinum]|uniref:ArsR/SmtB family transcription factor n=1 Tax=Salinigranum salinum TaxID=1364937 RepID=UPI001260445C|nr:helix-turn-helix domain-containing protein [Salinigranum salinum]
MATIERLSPGQYAEPERDHRYLSLEEAGTVLESLSSETAQSIVVELGSEPATPTEIAERTGTSIQNVSYHLSRLEDAELVTVVGTRYSEKGREMKLYASAVTSLVIGEAAGAGAGTDTEDG